MAFNATNLTLGTDDYTAGRLWNYTTSDDVLDTASGSYFDPKYFRTQDIIRVSAADGDVVWYVNNVIYGAPAVSVVQIALTF